MARHNLRNHKLYYIWKNMKARCFNTNFKQFQDYGGRGITICNEWLDIQNFINDMYPTFEEGLTLDRIDVNGNYCKENCRWAKRTTQSRNTRLIHKHNTSGFRGVSYNKNSKTYMAYIKVNRKRIYLGYHKTAEDGARAYDKYVLDNNLEHTRNFS